MDPRIEKSMKLRLYLAVEFYLSLRDNQNSADDENTLLQFSHEHGKDFHDSFGFIRSDNLSLQKILQLLEFKKIDLNKVAEILKRHNIHLYNFTTN